jgi:hypothetical protein
MRKLRGEGSYHPFRCVELKFGHFQVAFGQILVSSGFGRSLAGVQIMDGVGR